MQVQQLPYIAPVTKANWRFQQPASERVPVTDYELYGSMDPLELMCLMEEVTGQSGFERSSK
jgi:hypothetical protein